jgi:hypothetical protein
MSEAISGDAWAEFPGLGTRVRVRRGINRIQEGEIVSFVWFNGVPMADVRFMYASSYEPDVVEAVYVPLAMHEMEIVETPDGEYPAVCMA